MSAIISLGLRIPNQTFARPSETADVPASWTTLSGSPTWTALYGQGPAYSHPRTQRIALGTATGTSTTTIASAPGPPGHLCANATNQPLIGYMLYRSTGVGTDQRPVLYLEGRRSNGTQVDRIALGTIANNNSDWYLQTLTPTISWSGTNCHHKRLQLEIVRSTGTHAALTLDLAFLGIGIWASGTGYYAMPQDVAPRGSTPAFAQHQTTYYTNANGEDRSIDWSRFVAPRAGVLAYDWLPQTAVDALSYAWSMSQGRHIENGTTNPQGGRWPLLIAPGLPLWPKVLMVRPSERALGLEVAGDWISDPSFYSGGLPLVEIV